MAIDFADLAVRVNYGDVDKAAQALDRLKTAGAAAERSTNNVSAASVSATRGMGAWAAIQAEAAGKVGEHSLSIGRLERAFASMVGQALGANQAVEILGAGLLKFSVGTIETAGILGGLALVALAYEKITSAASEAKKAADDMLDAARQANYAAGPGGKPAAVQYGIQLKEYHELEARKSTLEAFGQSTTQVETQLAGALIQLENTWRRLPMGTLSTVTTQGRSPEQIAREAEAAGRKSQEEGIRYREFMSHTYGDLGTHGHDFSRGLINQQLQNAQENALPNVLQAIQKLTATTIEPFKFSGFDDDTKKIIEHAAAVKQLNDRYEDAKGKFSSMSNALDDFKTGLKEAATGLLEQFSPGALAQNLVGGLVNQVTGYVSHEIGLAVGGVRHALFGQNGEERAAQREAAASAHAMALQIDEVTQSLSHNALGAALDQLQIQLISTLHSIDQALPGTRREGERNRLRAEAASQEQEQEAQARHHDALNKQYALEDLTVRNLRATGQGDAANLLAFKDQQERELQKAIDENRDATYINNLRLVENNELIAYLNGTLQDATRNSPTGFFANSYYSAYASPRGSDPFGTGLPPLNQPGTGASGSGLTPPGGRGAPVTLVFQPGALVMDKNGVMNVVLEKIDQQAGATNGAGTDRASALNRMARS